MRLRPLDVLRGVAIILVLGEHMVPPAIDTPIVWPFTLWLRIGWSGVDLFFVLSGYLVAGLLFREYLATGTIAPLRFLARRGCKIYPPFYVLLAETAVGLWSRGELATYAGALMRDAVYVQNYVPGFWDHTWSLAVEEHFYFLLAAGIALAVRRREPLRYLPHLVIAVGFVALAARVHAAVAWGERSYTTGPTHARIDTLAWGVALAYFVECRGWRPPAWLLWVGIAAFIPWAVVDARGSFFLATGGLTVVGLGSAALVAGSLRRQASSAPLRAIAFVGRYSYGIYLWHLVTRSFVHGMIGPLPRAWWYVGLGAYLAVAIAFGCLVSLGIERPALRWRDRILPALGNPEEKLGLIAPPAHAGPAPRLEASA